MTVPALSDVHVSIAGLDKTYRLPHGQTVVALSQLNLDIRRGEFVSVVGPSGCGKSTLLKCIAGIVGINGGSIYIGGVPVAAPPDDMAIVFQRDILLDWRSVIENVLFPIEIKRLRGQEWSQRASELLTMIGLPGYENRHPWELSGGQRQRVAICRALIQEPKLLLMDEPFGALDALTRDEMNLELQKIWMNTGKTILFITHSISEAVLLSDHVAIMAANPGRMLDIIAVDLPRPRNLDMRETAEFGRYAQHIRHLFEDLGLLKSAP